MISRLRTKARRSVSSALERLESELSTVRDEVVGLGENVPKILTRREGHPRLRLGCEGRERVTAPPW
jgi:hypothetical protein